MSSAIAGKVNASVIRCRNEEIRVSTREGAVVVVGSINADLVVRTPRFPQPGETVSGEDLATLPGGKGANQAVAAARLGAKVRMVGAVGGDAHAAFLLDSIAGAGVDISRVATRSEKATGTAVITVDDNAENTIVVSPGANGTLDPSDLNPEVFTDAAVLALALEIPMRTVVAAAQLAKAQGVRVVTNLSPLKAIPAELLACTDVLIVNEIESEAVDLAAVPNVIVTKGASGATVIAPDGTHTDILAIRVTPVDTTGCGDAFMGAVARELAAGASLVAAAQFAIAVGAYAATKAGAQTSYPTLAELEAFLG